MFQRSLLPLQFALCAATAWLFTLSYELGRMASVVQEMPARLGYLSELAIVYSSIGWLGLAVLHGLRALTLRLRHPMAVQCAGIALLAALPAERFAHLLTGGAGLLDSAAEVPLRVAFTLIAIAGYVCVWALHLALCRNEWLGPRLRRRFAALSPRAKSRAWRLGAGAGAAMLVGFAYTANEQLRAYGFVVSFVMPAVWLLGASVFYAATRSTAAWMTINTLSVAFLVGSAAYGFANETPVRHAKAEFIRRGGLATLTESARHFAAPPRYANLTLPREARTAARCAKPAQAAPAQPTALTTDPARRRNVILISIDAWRRDSLTAKLMPDVSAFAARSVRFERAITPYPATLFALSGVLTGAYPSEVLLAPASLPDVLQRTAASWDVRLAIWPDVHWFRQTALPALITRNLTPQLLLGAARQTDRLLEELSAARAANKRTFAWVHYYEPHQTQAAGLRTRGSQARERYDMLVRYVDAHIGRLLAELEKQGYFEDSLIVIFGDHGEALGELGYYGHHVYLNQFIGDVPLIVHAPGLAAGTSDQLATLIDIAPTVLEWTGAEEVALDGEARSLFELAQSRTERYGLSEAFPVRGRLLYDIVRQPILDRSALLERLSLVQSGSADYQPKVALVSSRERLIVNRVTGDQEFYDRVADPREAVDLSQEGLPAHARMRTALGRAMQRMATRIACRIAADGTQ